MSSIQNVVPKCKECIKERNPVLYQAVGYALIMDRLKKKISLTETYPVTICLS